MASQGSDPGAQVPRAPASRGCSGSSSGTRGQWRRKDRSERARRPGPAKAPAVAEGAGPCLPQNVLNERERRKRISVSCERLRALLPQFNGRREDMASVLEMSVQFLRLAGSLAPGREQHAVLTSNDDNPWHRWQRDIVQLALANQPLAGAPDPRTRASSVTTRQGPPSSGVQDDEAPVGAAEALGRPAVLPGPSGLAPRPPGLSAPQDLRPQPPASPLGSEGALSCLAQAGSLPEETDRAGAPYSRSVLGSDMEDGSFLLSASPDWWLGSLEGRGGSVLTRAPARSGSFLADPEPGSQELLDGPLEPWGPDMGCPGLALREEGDTIFPDFFAC